MNKTNLPVILGASFVLFAIVANIYITYMNFKHPEWMLVPYATFTVT